MNNEWNRTQFDWCITRLCDKYRIELTHVNCTYSSTIGNLSYRNLPDACGAAAEIARRARPQIPKTTMHVPTYEWGSNSDCESMEEGRAGFISLQVMGGHTQLDQNCEIEVSRSAEFS